MNVRQARQELPKFAKGLAPFAVTVIALRNAVIEELSMYRAGDNPLEPKQVAQLERFLQKTQ